MLLHACWTIVFAKVIRLEDLVQALLLVRTAPLDLIEVRLIDRHIEEASGALKVLVNLQVVEDAVVEGHVTLVLFLFAHRNLLRLLRVPRRELHRVVWVHLLACLHNLRLPHDMNLAVAGLRDGRRRDVVL